MVVITSWPGGQHTCIPEGDVDGTSGGGQPNAGSRSAKSIQLIIRLSKAFPYVHCPRYYIAELLCN